MPKLLIKILLGLAAILTLLSVARWFQSLDGVTTIALNGREVAIQTSALFGLLLLVFAALWIAIFILRKGVGGLIGVATFFGRRDHQNGLNALSKALVALAENDGQKALRHATRAERLLKNPDLTRLVHAQAARMSGDERLAEIYFEAMSEDPDTDFLGVQGLLGQALRDDKPERALRLAERAHALRPRAPEILDTMFKLQRDKGDWGAARKTVEASVRAKRFTRDVGDRRMAVLHLADAEQRSAAGDRAGALREAMASVRHAPGLAPAAALAARLLIEDDEARTAARLVTTAWRHEPHPDLAAAYAAIEPDETPTQRYRRFGKLFEAKPRHEETRLLKAELAIAADALEEARDALGDLATTTPSARACALMAAIEQSQAAGEVIVRGWLSKAAAAPRGPQWVCDNCGAGRRLMAPHLLFLLRIRHHNLATLDEWRRGRRCGALSAVGVGRRRLGEWRRRRDAGRPARIGPKRVVARPHRLDVFHRRSSRRRCASRRARYGSATDRVARLARRVEARFASGNAFDWGRGVDMDARVRDEF